MSDPRSHAGDSKPTLIARLVILGFVVAVVVAGFVARWLERPKAVAPPPPIAASAPSVALVPKPAPLTRADLIANADKAAAAYASGAPTAPGKDPLLGRSFVVKIAFGCDGPQLGPGASQAHFEYDPQKKSLKLSAAAIDWMALPQMQRLPNISNVEAVEGFWAPHPWNSSDACPPRRDEPAPATPTPPAAQTLGLAAIYEKGGSRVLRRDGRPYEWVKPLRDGAAPLAQSYRLILQGRIVGYPDGRAAHCWAETPDHRPVCIYAVAFDRVAFEDDAGHGLAEWLQ